MQELQTYLHMLLHNWWIIILTGLAALNLSLAASYNATPMYQASSRLVISPGQTILTSKGSDIVRGIESLAERSTIVTYSEILNSERIRNDTFARLNLDLDTASNYEIWAVVLPESSVLEVFVNGPDPEMTALLANEVSIQSINYIKGLYQIYDISFLGEASVPRSAYSPQPIKDASVALVLGLIIGCALALARGHLTAFLAKDTKPATSENTEQGLIVADQIQPTPRTQNYYTNVSFEDTENRLAIGSFHLNGLKQASPDIQEMLFQFSVDQVSSYLQMNYGSDDPLSYIDDQHFAFKVIYLDVSDPLVVQKSYIQLHQMLKHPVEIVQNSKIKWIYLDPHTGVSIGRLSLPIETLIQEATIALDQAPMASDKIVFYDRLHRRLRNQQHQQYQDLYGNE